MMDNDDDANDSIEYDDNYDVWPGFNSWYVNDIGVSVPTMMITMGVNGDNYFTGENLVSTLQGERENKHVGGRFNFLDDEEYDKYLVIAAADDHFHYFSYIILLLLVIFKIFFGNTLPLI